MRFLIALSIALSLHAENHEEDLFLRRIAEFWEEGEHHLAKTQIENFLISYPTSPYSDALTKAMGDLCLREKNYSQALEFYSKIENPDLISESFLNKMQCLFELQWYVTLADECERFLEKSPDINVSYFLATSLYAQMLNATKNEELLTSLATKAKPHFESLLQSDLKEDIEEGYAHLCYVLKDFQNAIKVYREIAEKNKEKEEDLLFQIALIEAEIDKEKAVHTFSRIVELNQSKAKDAAYNRLVLLYDLEKYEECADLTLLENIAENKIETATLLLGKSLMQANKLDDAIALLKKSDSFDSLSCLIDAAFQANDLNTLNDAIFLLSSQFPDTKELPKAHFSKALLLKKLDHLEEAKQELNHLLEKFPESEQKTQTLFELTHLDFKAQNWPLCYERGREFLQKVHDQNLTPFIWHYVLISSTEMAKIDPAWKPQLISDLEVYLDFDPSPEWKILLAKTYYETNELDKAINLVSNLDDPNAHLIFAFCHKESDPDLFIHEAELALEKNANLLTKGAIHSALFNAYIDREDLSSAAEHLYAAFQENEPIRDENLLWLAENYILKTENNFVFIHRVASLLEKCKNRSTKNTVDLANMVFMLGKVEEAISILDALVEKTPDSQLLLAECNMKRGKFEEAKKLFETIVNESPNLRSKLSAKAAFELAKLEPSLEKKATQLKNIVIQKTFDAEPIYLESALAYLEVQGETLPLLQKIKHDFERTDDLLSKDYHATRKEFPEIDQIYQDYMALIDAKILLLSQRSDEARKLLHQIIEHNYGATLLERAHMLLTKIDEQAKI